MSDNVCTMCLLLAISLVLCFGVVAGDIDGDGAVNLDELAELSRHWARTDCFADDLCLGADLNADGRVDIEDLLIIAHSWLEFDIVLPIPVQYPSGLLVDLHPHPLAVEDLNAPRLSWIVQDPRRGAAQTARQILVATGPDLLTPDAADVWDSGRFEAAASVAVPYAGPSLEPATRYYWTVRTWDQTDTAGPFAAPAVFGTALKDGWHACPIWAEDVDPFHDWQDYTVSFDATIHENAATVCFRAADFANTYMWQFHAEDNTLRRHVFLNNAFTLDVVDLDFDLQTETAYRVSIDVFGSAIRTYIDGQLIDETQNTTFSHGTVGFRHGNLEQATYANLEVKAADESILFHSDLISENPFSCGTLTSNGVRFGRGERCLLPATGDGSSPDDYPRSGNHWALLRTDFEVLDKPIAYATLYATGVWPEPAAQHVYRAELNGDFVGVGPTRGYDGMIFYNAFDVTGRLLPGANALAFVAYAASGQAVQAQLEIVYADGERQRVATNTSDWQARSGSDLYLDVGNAGHSNYYYAPREYLRADRWPHGFSQPGFDASTWTTPIQRPALEGLTGLGTRNLKQEIREPVTVEQIGPGAYRMDFGRTVVGGLRLTVDGSQGDEIDIRLGEELTGTGAVRFEMRTGNHYRDRWTLAEGAQTLEHFGYRVFRYAEVHGLPESVDANAIVGIGLVYPFDEDAAHFSSSDPHLDDVWEFSRESIRLLNMDLYMDTPSRERRAYEGDAYLQQLAHYALDREFALARHSTEYLYFNYTWPTEWKLTSPSAAWRDYLQTGDDRSAARYYDLLRDTKTLLDFTDDRDLVVKDPGGAHSPDAWTDLIDWPAGLRDGYVFSDINTVINAYNYRTVRDLGRLAAALGYDDDAADLAATADSAATAINAFLYDPETGLYRDGFDIDHHALHASIFPLAFGIATEREAGAAQALADRRIVGNIFSAAYQVEALFALGRAEDALDLLTSDDLKSWRNMIAIGAGTTMETWDPSLKGNTTFSHPAGASPAHLIPVGLFGIDALESGHRRFTVEPRPGGLDHAEIRVPTLSGTIHAAFERDGDRLLFDLTVPANTTAELRLSGSIREGGSSVHEVEGIQVVEFNDGTVTLEVRSGTYAFTVDPDQTPPAPDPMSWAFPPEAGRLAASDFSVSTDFTGRTLNGNTAANVTWTTTGAVDTGSLPIIAGHTAIYQHDFTGSSSDGLNGVTLDVGGQTWTAGTAFRADGSIAGGGGGAWLDFVPQAGLSYTLSADLTVDAVNNNWIALGFARNPGVQLNANQGRHSNLANGIAWALHRVNNDTTRPNQQFFQGPNTNAMLGDFEIQTMTVNVVITLDARDPDNVWAGLHLNDGQGIVPATNIGSLADLAIQGVGFSNDGNNTGRIDKFSLTAIPEPSMAELVAVDVNNTGSLDGLFDTPDAADRFIPKINIESQGPWSATVNLQPMDTSIALNEVVLDYQHVSNQGTIPTAEKRGNLTVSVSGSTSGLIGSITVDHLVLANDGSGSDTFTFNPALELSAGQSYALVITAEGRGDDTYVGLEGISLFTQTLDRTDTRNSVSMTAATASDPSGVEYYFENVCGAGNDSGWQDCTHYTDIGLWPDTAYSYRVRARDKSEAQNITGWSPVASATTAAIEMNMLVFITDDQRWDAFGAGGSDFIHTPNMDKLAESGVHFTNAFVTTSICMTSRASILTGQYMSRHGIDRFGKELTHEAFAETYPAVMRSAGYWSGFVGKWHVGSLRAGDFNFSRAYHGRHWYQIDGEDIHVTERNKQDSLAFLAQRPVDTPFVLSLSTFAPHAQDNHEDQYLPQAWSAQYYEDVTVPTSVTMDESYLAALPHFLSQELNEGRIRYHWRFDTPERFQRYMINYFRLITEVDEALGRIIDELKDQGVYENTLIIFMGDNGYFHADRGLADKWYPYEESIRVPLIIYDPRLPEEKRGVKVEQMVLNIDLAPTILNAAGLPVPDNMQGRDLAPLYLAEEPPQWREDFLYEHPTISNPDRIPTSQAVIRMDYKYIYWPEWNHEQLFDLTVDPTEKTNLLGDPGYEAVLDEMRNRLQHLLEMGI